MQLKQYRLFIKKQTIQFVDEILGRAFLYVFLADLIGYFIGTIVLITADIIKNGTTYLILYLLSWFIAIIGAPYDLPSLIITIFCVAVSMVLTFVFSYSKVLTETDLSKKQRFISALIIALITAPYYFLFSIGIPL